jgi:hypothetical protein
MNHTSALDIFASIFLMLSIYFLLNSTEDIVRDFKNKVVQEKWNDFRSDVLARRHQRHTHLLQAAQHATADHASKAALSSQRLEQLDAAIDTMTAQFSDQVVAMEYDANQVALQYGGSSASGDDSATEHTPKEDACLGPRAHWMVCAQKYYHDTRPCDAYLSVLEKCVQETIVRASLSSSSSSVHPY